MRIAINIINHQKISILNSTLTISMQCHHHRLLTYLPIDCLQILHDCFCISRFSCFRAIIVKVK